MFKNKSGVAIGKRILYVIFSLVISCFLWFYISVNENQDLTIDINNIPIEYIGEDVLSSKNLVVTNKDVSSVSLRLSGKRLTIAKLDKSNISITADLSDISSAGTHFIKYNTELARNINSSAVSVVSASADYVTITVKKMVTVEIPVRAVYNGQVADGYKSGIIECTPGIISVSGPEDEVSQIAEAWVVLERDNISQTIQESKTFTLLNKNGTELNLEHITTSVDSVMVVQEVSMVKEIPLDVNLIEGAGADSTNTVVGITPETITVSGDPEVLKTLNKITVGTIDLRSFQSTYTETKSIVLPDDVSNDSGVNTAEIAVRIVGLVTTKLSASNIVVTNVTTGYSTKIITQSVDVTLRGSVSDISAVSAENIRLIADLEGLDKAEGTYEVEASVSVDGFPDLGAIGTYKINVVVSKSEKPDKSEQTDKSAVAAQSSQSTPSE